MSIPCDSYIEIIFDANRGQYIGEALGELLANNDGWKGYSKEDLETLLSGIDAEWYHDAWTNVLDSSYYLDDKGNKWLLYQDGDVFAYREDIPEHCQEQLFGM